ncbi:MAG TPA: MauE/DoxX family redox-associated membrane protein [Actinomycetota bacterium]|nr:MauE/DoxX family redox-associated membrane protein [Actinomycetota bacterium]
MLPLVPFLLALAFFWAAIAKASRPSAWRTALLGYRLPAMLVGPALVLVPVVEIVAGVLLSAGGVATKAGAALAVALLGSFSLAVLHARRLGGDRLPCGCFGGSGSRDYRLMLVRNAFLGAVAAAILLVPRVASYELEPPSASEAFPALAVAIAIVLIVWLVSSVRSADR